MDARIVPTLGHLRLRELTASRVREALLVWASAGIPTANRTRSVGAAMMAAALVDQVVDRNAFSDAPRLKYEAKQLDPFTPDELRRLIDAHEWYTAGPILSLLAGTGCRIGEAAALDVADWDAGKGTISITKTWSRDHGTRPPKSKHGRRVIRVPEVLAPIIAGVVEGRSKGPLFPSAGGTRFDSAQLHIVLTRTLKRLGIRRRGPHQMRHACASMLVASGVPIGDVARYLGHSAAMVVRTYLHPAGADVSAAIGRILGGSVTSV